jgi:hypothetical protein
LRIEPERVEIGQLGFVIVARFEIIVSLTQEARFSGFLGAGGNEENGQNKRYDSEEDFCLHVEEGFGVN